MSRLLDIVAGDHQYHALVEPLEDVAHRFRELSSGKPLACITDATVWRLHGERLNAVHPVDPILVPAGEAAKQWDVLRSVLEQLASRDIGRSTPILAFGGGSIGDLTGLAAGLFKRGCPVVHVPTTLLAQVDSAIGGKAAIDFAGQKNLVGLFHQPALVVADPSLLATLDDRQLRAGYAEFVKYGLIGDPPLFLWCEKEGPTVFSGEYEPRRSAVDRAIRCKARYVEKDPLDRTGVRAMLNFGHTFAHAIEAATGFGPVLHGEAVAIGMNLAFRLSVELGHCPKADADRVADHFRSVGLPTRLADAGLTGAAADLVALMLRDKKADGSGPRLVLTRGIGSAFLTNEVTAEQLTDFLHRSA